VAVAPTDPAAPADPAAPVADVTAGPAPVVGSDPGDGPDRFPGRFPGRWPGRWPLLIVTAAFVVSRVAAWLAGVRLDASALDGRFPSDQWQLLDVVQLKDHLVDSVWHLNSQPPLYNVAVGLVLHLPTGLQRPVEVVVALALGLLIAVATYLLLVELRVPVVAALVVTVVGVVASPSYLLYENWLSYAYPSAACGVVAALCLVRFLRTDRWGWGLGFFAAASTLVLLNSTYQVEWLVVVCAVCVVGARRHWRTVVAVALVPLLAVAVWTVKDAALFGTSTTSSWLGMNLARMVLFEVPPDQIAALERQGRITPLASVPAFGAPGAYVPRFVRARPSTVPVLGDLTKADGATNFNNPLYIAVSSQYLHDDLAYIRAHPQAYARDVGLAVRTWFTPPDQYFVIDPNWRHLGGYVRGYDAAVAWQPHVDPDVTILTLFSHQAPPDTWLSAQQALITALALVGAPVLAWRRRRSDAPMAATLGVLWFTLAYAFVVTSMLELGENERFAFELGPVPLVAATVVATALVRTLWRRTRRQSGADPVPVPVPVLVADPVPAPVPARGSIS